MNRSAVIRHKSKKHGGYMNIKERAKKLKFDVPAVFFALKDKETPILAKVLAFLTVAYALSPVDLVPDFIPVLGYMDDIIILPALVALTVKCIPKEIWVRSVSQSEGLWANGKPKKWYYAVPIVLVWALIIWLIVKAIWLWGFSLKERFECTKK